LVPCIGVCFVLKSFFGTFKYYLSVSHYYRMVINIWKKTPMPSNPELVKQAKAILEEKGFTNAEIYEEFWLKNHRIDVVGWSPTRKVAIECKPCTPEKRVDLRKFFDEVICLPIDHQIRPAPSKPARRTTNPLANMKLVLIRSNEIVFEVPLSREGWQKDILRDEIAFIEQDFHHFSRLFDALSHRNRLMMMKLLIEEQDLTKGFAEFIRDLDLNPKLVWESTKKLRQCGLLEKGSNGRYRCSKFGEASFMVNLVLRHLREMFESTERR